MAHRYGLQATFDGDNVLNHGFQATIDPWMN
jgi:hypothetical protein